MESDYNIVIILVDCMSPHLPVYGYERDTAPHLATLLEKATVFLNCHSPVGWTLPACSSIITGLLPEQHGLHTHHQRFKDPKICQLLGKEYYKIGITNNGNLIPDREVIEGVEALPVNSKQKKFMSCGWQVGFDEYLWTRTEDHERPFRQAIDFLDNRARPSIKKPYFLFFHTNIVHDYYFDYEYYRNTSEWIGKDIPSQLHISKPDIAGKIWEKPSTGLEREELKLLLTAKYDAAIRYSDYKLKAIFSRLDFDNSIVVFMSDHGEGFDYENARIHHGGRLFNELTHVPLIVWLPKQLRNKIMPVTTEGKYCSTIDVASTVLQLVGKDNSTLPGEFLFNLPGNRNLKGCEKGYIYWNGALYKNSYADCNIDIRSNLAFPLKTIYEKKDNEKKEYYYNLAYDSRELNNLLDSERVGSFTRKPITFIVAVNDHDELQQNLLSSAVAKSGEHQWLLIDNESNGKYESISLLYSDAMMKAEHELVLFIHQDVYLPPDWEYRLNLALSELENTDPHWGVVGAVGKVFSSGKSLGEFLGHWSDPKGYFRKGPFPSRVRALDELWLGIRQNNGVKFDRNFPGFHCYGADLSLTALKQGKLSYAIDAYVWHKFKTGDGKLIEKKMDSDKIMHRDTDEFKSSYRTSAEYLSKKWPEFIRYENNMIMYKL